MWEPMKPFAPVTHTTSDSVLSEEAIRWFEFWRGKN